MEDEMNGYIAFHKGRRVEVYASSSYDAQQRAAAMLKVKATKSYEVTVVLAEKDGEQVTHNTGGL
jgi:ATP-dependent DNA ligase